MDTNPYQSPQTATAVPIVGTTVGKLVRIEGDALVLPTGTVLPQRCVLTNVAVTEQDMVRRDHPWCSGYVRLAILLGPIGLLVFYLALRKQCTVTYGLHPFFQRRYRKRLMIKVGITLSFFAGAFIAPLIVADGTNVVLGLLAVVSLVLTFLGNSPLWASHHDNGLFWIKGCSPEFLESLEAPST